MAFQSFIALLFSRTDINQDILNFCDFVGFGFQISVRETPLNKPNMGQVPYSKNVIYQYQ